MNTQPTTTNAITNPDPTTTIPTSPLDTAPLTEEQNPSSTGRYPAPASVVEERDFTNVLLLGPGCYLQVIDVLGEGSFGKVYRAKEVAAPGLSISQPCREFAVKTMAKGVGLSIDHQAAEAEIQTRMSSHPGVVTLHEAYEDETHLFFIMDIMSDGHLHDDIYNNEEGSEMDEATMKNIMLQLIDALDHCHKNDVYHRDLKPANILLSREGAEVKAHLADFGIATTERVGQSPCGTAQYISPEMYWSDANGGEINYAASDVWALGIVFAEMLAKTLPWGAAHWDDECFGTFLNEPKYFYRRFGISKQANAILAQMLELESESRITLPELKELVQDTNAFLRTRKVEAPASPTIPTVVLEEEKVFTPSAVQEILVEEGVVKKKVDAWERMIRQDAQ